MKKMKLSLVVLTKRILPIYLLTLLFIACTDDCPVPVCQEGLGDKFEKVKDLQVGDVYTDIISNTDGSFIVLGNVRSSPDVQNIYLFRLDQFGDIEWEKEFGGNGYSNASEIIPTADGGYILVGEQDNAGDTDAYLIKVNKGGDLIWEKIYGDVDRATTLIESPSGYIFAGSSNQGVGMSDIYIAEIQENGDMSWNNSFDESVSDLAFDICPAMDGGYLLTGYTQSQNAGQQIYLIKINDSGEKEWAQAYGGNLDDYGVKTIPANDNGYILISNINIGIGIGASQDISVRKIDDNGVEQWEKPFGGSGREGVQDITPSPDGGYALVGYTTNQGTGERDVYLIKIDEKGNLQWDETFGGSNHDSANAIDLIGDCGYVIAGYTTNGNNQDFYLIKTDLNGNTE